VICRKAGTYRLAAAQTFRRRPKSSQAECLKRPDLNATLFTLPSTKFKWIQANSSNSTQGIPPVRPCRAAASRQGIRNPMWQRRLATESGPRRPCHSSAIRNPQPAIPPALQYIIKSLYFMTIEPKQRPFLRVLSLFGANQLKCLALNGFRMKSLLFNRVSSGLIVHNCAKTRYFFCHRARQIPRSFTTPFHL
jgi:hypothetical protein